MMILLALLCAFAVGAVLLWRRSRRARQLRPGMARAKRPPFKRSTCPYCGEIGIVVRQDGEPHERFHPCAGRDLELRLRIAAGKAPNPAAIAPRNELADYLNAETDRLESENGDAA